jgi:small redox-active disulfide protein 2
MMKIEVLGPGCKNCESLEKATKEALGQLGVDADVDKITDYGEIAAYGVMSTPALAIDGEVVSSGRVPSVGEITELLAGAAG